MHDRYNLTSTDGVHVVALRLPVQLDHGEFDRLNEELSSMLRDRPGARFVLDLAEVEYTGSAVLGLLVNLRQGIVEAGGAVVLCELRPRLADILRACALERLFRTAKSRQAAMKALL